ncbi:Protein of unknown function (DUF1635 [Striga hermonthica]|uniref:Uncharacterized protein n=1 Tax=Striga hermonthica TaxID=68872 RepID=A0A9N7MUX6_STRHE|nr:Protein of unknown function (DUF1635 [Striga hermonthica]
MEGLRQSLILSMELEDTRVKAQEEVKARDHQIAQLKNLLSRALKERDQAQYKCHRAILDKLMLQNQIHRPGPIKSRASSIDDENIASPPPPPPPPLPEKGRLLQAVMGAGPLLQTLLVAGPLPRWRHPPPPLEAHLIPPAAAGIGDPFRIVGGCNNERKRGFSESSSSSSTGLKYQRVVPH